MEFLLVVVMILAGFAVAVAVITALAVAEKRTRSSAAALASAAGNDEIETSLLIGIGMLGGVEFDEALERARELLGARAVRPGVPGESIDVGTWAGAFRKRSSQGDRERLLDAAVRMAVMSSSSLPLGQYAALMDLSFGLGFQTDALARLRARYRFEYVDHAKQGRPPEADRRGRRAPSGGRPVDRDAKARVLGLGARFSRRELTSAYRRLAAKEHPDRFHLSSGTEQERASRRFIELTEAYEQLLPWAEED